MATIENVIAAAIATHIAAAEQAAQMNTWRKEMEEGECARREEMKEGVVKALLGQEGWLLRMAGGDGNGGTLCLYQEGALKGMFFGRYGSWGDVLCTPSGNGVTTESNFRLALLLSPIEGLTYSWTGGGRAKGGSLKDGIPYGEFYVEVENEEFSATTEEAAEKFADMLLDWEQKELDKERQFRMGRCDCSSLNLVCQGCRVKEENRIIDEGTVLLEERIFVAIRAAFDAGELEITEEGKELVRGYVAKLKFRSSTLTGKYDFEFEDAFETAELVLGTLEKKFSRWECTACPDGNVRTSSFEDEGEFCYGCGERWHKKFVVVRPAQPQVVVEVESKEDRAEPWECSVCGDRIWVQKGSNIKFHSKDGGAYRLAESEVRASGFAFTMEDTWKSWIQGIIEQGVDSRSTVIGGFQRIGYKLFDLIVGEFGWRLPEILDGLKARFGTVMGGIMHLLQGAEAIVLGVGAGDDAKRIAEKLHGMASKLINFDFNALFEAVGAGLPLEEHRAQFGNAFAQGVLTRLQVEALFVTAVSGTEDPFAIVLEEAMNKSPNWKATYLALWDAAKWAEAKHL